MSPRWTKWAGLPAHINQNKTKMKKQSRPLFAWLLLTKDEKMWYQLFYDVVYDIYYNTTTITSSKYYFFKRNMKKFNK